LWISLGEDPGLGNVGLNEGRLERGREKERKGRTRVSGREKKRNLSIYKPTRKNKETRERKKTSGKKLEEKGLKGRGGRRKMSGKKSVEEGVAN